MTGQELIDWIREHKAEEYEVRVRDNHSDVTECFPEIACERTRKWADYGEHGMYEITDRYYIDL